MSAVLNLLRDGINGTYTQAKREEGFFDKGTINFEFFSDLRTSMNSFDIVMGSFDSSKSPEVLAKEILDQHGDKLQDSEESISSAIVIGMSIFAIYNLIFNKKEPAKNDNYVDADKLKKANELSNKVRKEFDVIFDINKWKTRTDYKTGTFKLHNGEHIFNHGGIDIAGIKRKANEYVSHVNKLISAYTSIINNNEKVSKELFSIGIGGDYHEHPDLLTELTPKFLPILDKYKPVHLDIEKIEIPKDKAPDKDVPYLTKEQAPAIISLIKELMDISRDILYNSYDIEERIEDSAVFVYHWDNEDNNGAKNRFANWESREAWEKIHPKTKYLFSDVYEDAEWEKPLHELAADVDQTIRILMSYLIASVKDQPKLNGTKISFESIGFSEMFLSMFTPTKQTESTLEHFYANHKPSTITSETPLKKGLINIAGGAAIKPKNIDTSMKKVITELGLLIGNMKKYVVNTKPYYLKSFISNEKVASEIRRIGKGLDADFVAMPEDEFNELAQQYSEKISSFVETTPIKSGLPWPESTIGLKNESLLEKDDSFRYGTITMPGTFMINYPDHKELVELIMLVRECEIALLFISTTLKDFYDITNSNKNGLISARRENSPFKSRENEAHWSTISPKKCHWMYEDKNGEHSFFIYERFYDHIKEVMKVLMTLVEHSTKK